ncbi:MAG TPA: PspC domain-containing protein [Acidimicrobiia bacterium]|nr:PspC domain-containing protein [Acidimicrobiia bacterium]
MDTVAERRREIDIFRHATDRIVAGVAGGLANRLGVPSGYVRAAFVVLSLLWGLGVVAYVALWMATFERVEDRPPRLLDNRRQMGLGMMFVGALLLFRTVGWWSGDLPMLIVTTLAFGMAVLSDFDWLGRLLDPHAARPSKWRIGSGVVLLLAGLVALGGALSQLRTLGGITLAVLITLAGVVMVFGPWLVGLGRALTSERRERIRQEERAEMATHLHDSVLQTLALMQRTDDPKRIVTLARQQERELRAWLYGAEPGPNGQRFAAALEEAASRVEADFAIPVEVVSVGDTALDDVTRAVVAAAGEAMINAAKHSGASEVSVYAEIENGRVDVWVADQGRGFDLDSVPPDRRGLRDSIRGRMARVGGGAEIDARPGEGTEVHVWAPLSGEEGESR